MLSVWRNMIVDIPTAFFFSLMFPSSTQSDLKSLKWTLPLRNQDESTMELRKWINTRVLWYYTTKTGFFNMDFMKWMKIGFLTAQMDSEFHFLERLFTVNIFDIWRKDGTLLTDDSLYAWIFQFDLYEYDLVEC